MAESLGLSVGIVLESAMFRKVHPHAELLKIDDTPIADFVRKIGIRKEEHVDDSVWLIRDLVRNVSEIIISLILSENPEAMMFYLVHPFKPINSRIEDFASSAHGVLSHHTERAASIGSLLENPYAKLKALGILDDDLLKQYLNWSENYKGDGLTSNSWASILVESPKGKK